ncbi:MBL fold metallo-hydrolase [Methanobrevibacter acididurans]|uniref:MBL fold metallo-hydrolase n=1 Tax=Methanobrevibacter acididurans TaxID=120963 RepID=UPI0038FC6DB2
MKITFLGSGGGRFATISQKRMTGGFRIDDFAGKNYYIDPGPGALVRSYQFGLNPTTIDGVFVSHTHTDHYNDAEILIEAMTRGMTKNYGVIMGSQSVCEGYKKWGPAISDYHKSKSLNIVLKPGEVKRTKDFTIKGTKTIHGDPTGVGFQMKAGNITVSYTSDTKYFPELYKYHKDADILIASVLRPGTKSIKGHMCTNNFSNLVNEVKPKLAIMTHFGFKMLNSNPVNEAKKVMRKTGVKTIAAFDGLKIDIDENNIEKSKYSALKNHLMKNSNFNEVFPSDVEEKKPKKILK